MQLQETHSLPHVIVLGSALVRFGHIWSIQTDTDRCRQTQTHTQTPKYEAVPALRQTQHPQTNYVE